MLDLVGSDDSDLWSKTVLQACEQEDSFCRAVIAIGGLDQALETSQAIGKKCPVGHMGIDEPLLGQYRFALQQYDEFLTRMRRRLMEGPYDLRHTLISCILVVCFELFQGNHSTALSHASTGLDLIKKTLGPDKMQNWNSTGLDASLIQIFLRLDQISLSSALQSLTRTYVNTSTEIGDMEADALPSEFATCKEARSYWKVTVRRVSHASSRTTTHDLISDGHPWKSTTSSKDAVSEWHSTGLTGGLESKGPVCPDSSIGYLRQWSAAFQPLLNASRRESGKSFRSKAAFLQLRHNTTLLALVGSQSNSELVYDNFVSLFQETLHLARDVLSEPSSGHNGRRPIFTFDIGVIGSLWSVATKCRDSIMRWTAVSLLLKYPRREGVWDSAMIAEFASVLIRMEEKDLDDMSIPESVRVRGEAFSFDLVQKKGRLSYSRLADVPTSGSKTRVLESVEVSW
ncbi:hypothetical protein EG329_001739 [Mollisiaceae sp. DMI_Dod_QoI]|nr:hypothetical protein EG329_001739 [Helotiales sp. DMI_Dod_QoI]